MIWFFLMGMIAGAVGVVMVLNWWFKSHVVRLTREEFEQALEREEEDEQDKLR